MVQKPATDDAPGYDRQAERRGDAADLSELEVEGLQDIFEVGRRRGQREGYQEETSGEHPEMHAARPRFLSNQPFTTRVHVADRVPAPRSDITAH